MIEVLLSQGVFQKYFIENFPNHKQKHDVSLNSWHKANTKDIEYFIADKNKNRVIIQKSVQMVRRQFNYQYLDSITPFILFLVISFVWYQFIILRMSWYKYMTTF